MSIAARKALTQRQGWLERLFHLSEYDTDVRTEISAGITTFMTMAYVMIVHPSIMAAAGMPVAEMAVVTAITSGLFTLMMGLYANRPFALAPAMGSNVFFASTLVAGGIATWQQALGMVFISGMTFVALTVLGFREMIVKTIPKCIKVSIGAALGLFIAQLGMKNAGWMVAQGSLAIGDLTTPGAILAMIGFVIIAVMMSRGVKGALLWGILLTSAIGIPMGVTQLPTKIISLPPSIAPIAFKLDILGLLKLSFVPAMFIFFTGDFFSTLGTVLGVGGKAGLLDENGDLPGIEKPFLVDALVLWWAPCWAPLRSPPMWSLPGVEAGGRTGLTAVTTAVIFFLMLFLTPIATIIPSEATAPALVLIGLLMLPAIKEVDFGDFTEALPAFVTILFTAFTFNLANGISLGVLTYVVIKVASGRRHEVPLGMYILCLPLLYYLATL